MATCFKQPWPNPKKRALAPHPLPLLCGNIGRAPGRAGRLGLAPHLLDDARAVDGRVAVHGADDELELRLEALGLLRAGAHQREEAHALAVEAEVLGEGLREREGGPRSSGGHGA